MKYENDLSKFRIVRLNSDMFPVSEFEKQSYDRFGLNPVLSSAAGDRILDVASDCDAILIVSEALTDHVIDGLGKCRVISRIGAGTDKINRLAATRNGIVITNVPDFCVEEQADHTMALLLAVARKLPQMQCAMRTGKWNEARTICRPLRRLNTQTLGLIGFGLSAKAVARRAAGFGMRVLATRRNRSLHDPEVDLLNVKLTDFNTVLRESDFISLHVPLNGETRGMIGPKELAMMKPGSALINTSRGALVDEKALAAAIRSEHLAGAGLDTFRDIDVHASEDDRPPEHPLLELRTVALTPHVAAFSVESARDVSVGAVENVVSILSGHWPPKDRIVNPEVDPRNKLVNSQ